MKYLIFLFLGLISIFSTYATVASRELTCSTSGTDVIFVNGINWEEEYISEVLYNNIESEIPENFLDNSSQASSKVKFKLSYNHSNGFLRDMLESAAQKISQNFNISSGSAFVAAYYFTYRGVVAIDFIESIFEGNRPTFKSLANFMISFFSPSIIDNMVQDSFSVNLADTKSLKSSISSTLLRGKKLILITESQGNFFGKQAIQDFLNGENLSYGDKTGKISDYLGVIGQLQIAPPTGSLLPKNKVVLNDKDIINLVFFERPDSNFTLIPPSPDLRSSSIDRFSNHFITSTYLNSEKMTTGNLSQLRDFTLQSVVDIASELESNCPAQFRAIINYQRKGLWVTFDATDPDDPNITGLTYEWDFGNGDMLVTDKKRINYQYSEEGYYEVSLKVKDATGATRRDYAELSLQYSEYSFILPIEPKGTYLFTDCSDSNPYGADCALPATSLDLTSLYNDPNVNLREGDIISIVAAGNPTYPGILGGLDQILLAVFEGDSGFLSPGPNSVASEIISQPTLGRNISTDIPEDRMINFYSLHALNPTLLQIPYGAKRIKFSLNDGHFKDNYGYPGANIQAWIKMKIVRNSQPQLD